MWDPTKLSENWVKYYLIHAKRMWPRKQYKFSEELALNLLHLKNYKIEDALLTLIYSKSQLVTLIHINNRLFQNLTDAYQGPLISKKV